LLSIKEQHLRLVAGVPSGTQVDLSLIKLPEGSLIFPSPCGVDLTRPRRSNTLTRCFEARARKRFPGQRFHGLRGVMRPYYLMLEFRCMWLPIGAVTIRRCFCGATPSGPRRPTRPPPTSSAACRKQFWNSLGPIWDPTLVSFSRRSNEIKVLDSPGHRYCALHSPWYLRAKSPSDKHHLT